LDITIIPLTDRWARREFALCSFALRATASPMNSLRGLAFLLLLQAIGEALSHSLKLPVPGPVIGMLLLLPALQFECLRVAVAAAAELLLAHLSLLFIPVGVGVITHLSVLSQYGPKLLLVIALSTWAGMAVTALVLRAVLGDEKERDHG
jgi:holin-like protein